MTAYESILSKLERFYKKYYVNKVIRGLILFTSIGLLYLIAILLVEHFLWLTPQYRSFLFWCFVSVELILIWKFIFIPIFQLFKLRKGIALEDSSKIIGNFFPKIEDKLLNILQLKNTSDSELVLASIEQKSVEIQPISFQKAINFKTNIKYLKYVLIPFLIWLIFILIGLNSQLENSLTRVVNYNKAYVPPAPFSFIIENQKLTVIEGKSFTLRVSVVGNVVPSEVLIKYDNQEYYLKKNNLDFSYIFSEVTEPIQFYLTSNEVKSKPYVLEVINTPTIQDISLKLKYPKHLNKKNEVIQNVSNLILPEGTKATWLAVTNQTDSLSFLENTKRVFFKKKDKNLFEFEKTISKPFRYEITSSNRQLKDFERLQYSIDILKDQYPKINVFSNIDSIKTEPIIFGGQISDDYGLSKLELVCYNEDTPNVVNKKLLEITNENVQTFFYDFSSNVELDKGINYEFFFVVYDNDSYNGSKKTTSKKFNYREKTIEEAQDEFFKNQKKELDNLQNSINNQKKQKEILDKIQQELQNKKNPNWNDKKKIEQFIRRQNRYKEMMNRQTDKLQESIQEQEELTPSLKRQKEALKERFKELQKQNNQEKLLDELQKLSEKLDKENLVKKAKQLSEQNKQQEKSLERILELTKRFYVEQKTMQMSQKLDKLSKKQDSINNEEIKAIENQKKIEKDFNKIKKELEELNKSNEQLKESMPLPDLDDEKEDAEESLDKANDELDKKNNKEAKKSQKRASSKMKQMSQKLSQSMMDMQSKMIDENIEDMRQILKNLIEFSFKQESLMDRFGSISATHPDFGKELKKQNQIKSYFEHIDDSLYVLSLRTPMISAKIQEDLANAHYNLDESLENFAENQFDTGLTNQQYVMTSANNLVDFFSNMLDNAQNSMSGNASGQMPEGQKKNGKGKSNSGLPDIIQKQKGLSDKLKEGMKKGKEGKQNQREELDGEQYEIYQQQNKLKQELQDLLEKENFGNSKAAKKALREMEDLENQILNKGFDPATLQKMQNLDYELLKLETAAQQQGQDKRRKSVTNNTQFSKPNIRNLKLKKQFYNQIEILNRQSLPLQDNFKKRVQEYFLTKETKI